MRRASTTVELRDGQSFVIGGLLQNDNKNSIEQLPWLGSVPVLGTLFSAKSYQKNETDLAIIVTPRLVRPARPNDVVRSPDDDTLPPNDADFFLLGKTEVTRKEARAMPAVTATVAAAECAVHRPMLDIPRGGFPMRPSSNALRGLALAALLATLAGCSEYFERSNNVSLTGGNAVATNKVTQMVDPGRRQCQPRYRLSGERMETAVDRYRAGRVIQPRGTGTSGT